MFLKDKKNNTLLFVIVVAAIVAALTSVAVLFLRARSRRRALTEFNDHFDYDYDEYDDCDYCITTDIEDENDPIEISHLHEDVE